MYHEIGQEIGLEPDIVPVNLDVTAESSLSIDD